MAAKSLQSACLITTSTGCFRIPLCSTYSEGNCGNLAASRKNSTEGKWLKHF